MFGSVISSILALPDPGSRQSAWLSTASQNTSREFQKPDRLMIPGSKTRKNCPRLCGLPSDAFSNFVSIDNLEPVTIADRTSATIAKQKPRVPPAERILPFNASSAMNQCTLSSSSPIEDRSPAPISLSTVGWMISEPVSRDTWSYWRSRKAPVSGRCADTMFAWPCGMMDRPVSTAKTFGRKFKVLVPSNPKSTRAVATPSFANPILDARLSKSIPAVSNFHLKLHNLQCD